MRRTLWTVPVDDAAIVQRSSGDAVAAAERKRLVRLVEDKGVAKDGARWLRRVEGKAMAAIEARRGHGRRGALEGGSTSWRCGCR